MGAQLKYCCQSTTLDQQILNSSMSQEEIFFRHFPIVQKVLEQEIYFKDYYDETIKKKFTTIFQSEGIFMGKKDCYHREGEGIMIYNNGFYYIGEWQNNKREGYGSLIAKNGSYYQGYFSKGVPSGEGEYVDHLKSYWYKGLWKNGIIHGLGQEATDKYSFKGIFKKGLKNGQGQISYQDGTVYSGNFRNDKMDGEGILQGKKFKYCGQFKGNVFNGTGKCQFYGEGKTVKQVYIGQYKRGLKHGFGQYRWIGRQTFKGMWLYGKIVNSQGLIVQYDDTLERMIERRSIIRSCASRTNLCTQLDQENQFDEIKSEMVDKTYLIPLQYLE